MQKAKAQTEEAVREMAVPSRSSATDEEIHLTGLLLQRMARFCKERDILFILCDLPTVDLKNSLDVSARQWVDPWNAMVVKGLALVEPYKNRTNIHVTNGHRHLSESAHELVGIGLADAIGKEHGRIPGPFHP